MRAELWALVAALLVCAAVPSSTSAQEQLAIHVAVSAFESQAGAYYAQDLGLFKRAGLNVEIMQMQGGEAIVAAMLSGAVQVGAATTVPLANAHLRGIDVVLVAAGTISDNTLPQAVSGLIVAPNSPLKTGKDFAGKTVAVNNLHSIDQIAVEAWTDSTGGDAKTVRFIELPNVMMGDAAAAVLAKYMRLQSPRAHERHANTLDAGLLQPLIDAAARYKVIPAQFDVREMIWTPPVR